MWPNPQFPADLITFTEQIPNEKLHFMTMTIIVYRIYIKLSVLWKANPISRFLDKTLAYTKVITVKSLIARGEKLPSNAILLSNSYEIVTFEWS